jgi:hypothetical protein
VDTLNFTSIKKIEKVYSKENEGTLKFWLKISGSMLFSDYLLA